MYDDRNSNPRYYYLIILFLYLPSLGKADKDFTACKCATSHQTSNIIPTTKVDEICSPYTILSPQTSPYIMAVICPRQANHSDWTEFIAY
ncbi:unnamed protein product [Linum trigynum]|uniref:Secreted protein n=1 Tax=Linum trigynum TaxID=586398 RepID=A0AAV2DJC2_9ROSI